MCVLKVGEGLGPSTHLWKGVGISPDSIDNPISLECEKVTSGVVCVLFFTLNVSKCPLVEKN